MNHYDNAQDKAGQVAIRLEGLAYLFLNTRIEGSGDRDTEAHQGIGLILEDLARQTREVDNMLDQAVRPTGMNTNEILKRAAPSL